MIGGVGGMARKPSPSLARTACGNARRPSCEGQANVCRQGRKDATCRPAAYAPESFRAAAGRLVRLSLAQVSCEGRDLLDADRLISVLRNLPAYGLMLDGLTAIALQMTARQRSKASRKPGKRGHHRVAPFQMARLDPFDLGVELGIRAVQRRLEFKDQPPLFANLVV